MILLTSFKRAAENEADHPNASIWSGAVYQPKWLPQRPKAEWMDIRPDGKTWIRPREYLDRDEPLEGYFQALLDLYESRVDAFWRWAKEVYLTTSDVWVCCWCPYDKAAQRQIEEFGTFVCHTAAVGEFMYRKGFRVTYDRDRMSGMVRAHEYVT